MLKRYIKTFGVGFVAIALSFIHIFSPIATLAMSSESSHGRHANTTIHLSSCQETPVNQKFKPISIFKKRTNKPEPAVAFSVAPSVTDSGIGLLKPTNLWLQSSWTPPDLLLLSSRYTTSA